MVVERTYGVFFTCVCERSELPPHGIHHTASFTHFYIFWSAPVSEVRPKFVSLGRNENEKRKTKFFDELHFDFESV